MSLREICCSFPIYKTRVINTAKTFLFRRIFSTMLVIGIRTKMKRKYRIDAGSVLCSPERKPKLRPTQPKVYSVAKEWRRETLVHRSTSHPRGKRDSILKSED